MNETLKGALDRALLVALTWGLTWMATKGYISNNDVAQLAPALVLVVGTAIAYLVNRPGSLANAAANTGSVVISQPQVAKAADNPNVLSTTAGKVEVAEAIRDIKASA